MSRSIPREPALSVGDAELDALLRRLNLATLRRTDRSAVARAEQGEGSYRDFLALLVAEGGRWITLDGPSGRTQHLRLEDSLPHRSDGARISGNPGPDFPEPTIYTGSAAARSHR